jgi:hypothetical protein
MNARKRTPLRLIAGGLSEEPAGPCPSVEPRERAAMIVVGIAYQCDPSEFADGRTPERVERAWSPATPDVFMGEALSERPEAYEWLQLIVEALDEDDRAA